MQILISKILFVCLFSFQAAANANCIQALEDYVTVNDVAVTGDFYYPLDLVLKNLNLTKEDVKTYKRKVTISLAEGVSHFLPYFLSQGIPIVALDLWYKDQRFPDNSTGRLMRQYVQQYNPHLIAADATKIPLPDKSIDVVFSHMLLNNIGYEEQLDVLKESIRILKKNGEARLFGIGDGQAIEIAQFLDQNYKDWIEFSFHKKNFSFVLHGEKYNHVAYLLVIKKRSAY